MVLAGSPFPKQDGRCIFVEEVGSQGAFEGSPEEHGGPGVFLLPAVEVAITIAAGAGQVLGNLGVAIVHPATSELPTFSSEAVDSSSHWLAGAKPSKFSREVRFTMVWLTLTTPRSPNKAFSSTSSRPSRSGS